MLVVATILPGICEETLFRGAIQGLWERRGAVRAVTGTALLFSVYHLSPHLLVAGFFLGIIFGTAAWRTGSILPAILLHMFANATAFTVASLRPVAASEPPLPLWILGV